MSEHTTSGVSDTTDAPDTGNRRTAARAIEAIPIEVRVGVLLAWVFSLVDNLTTGLLIGVGVALLGLVLRRFGGRTSIDSRHVSIGYVVVAVTVAAAAAPFLAVNSFRVNQLAVLAYIVIALHGLNLLIGMAGQMALAHVAFMGVGAYSVAILAGRYDRTLAEGLLVGAILAATTGLLLAIPTLRLHGHNLAIATLSFAIIFGQVMKLEVLSGLTGGFQGISLFDRNFGPPFTVSWLSDVQWHYLLSAAIAGLATLVFVAIQHSGAGRGLRAMRESPLAAPAMGVDMVRSRVIAFTLSAVFAGVAGGLLFIVTNRFVSPDAFTLTFMIELLVALIVGGLGLARGALLGGLFLVFIYREAVASLSREIGSGQYLRIAILAGFMGMLLAARRVGVPRWLRARAGDRPGEWLSVAFALGVGLLVGAVTFAIWWLLGDRFEPSGVGNLVTGSVLIISVLSLPDGIAGLFPVARRTADPSSQTEPEAEGGRERQNTTA